MAEYVDSGHRMFQNMLTEVQREILRKNEKEAVNVGNKGPVDPNAFLRVREAVCVVGFDRQAVADMKHQVGCLLEDPFAIEGFHAKTRSDLKDGALLVPKLLLVAKHCPGRKLLDQEGNQGQLDYLYDEAVEIEADIMVVYIDLPRLIYKPMRHMVHHPKLAEMLFPTQPLLRQLAADNCLITVTEKSELNNMQKNVIREWLTKPVNERHPVYKVAEHMSTVELSRSGVFNFNKSGLSMKYYTPPTSADYEPYDVNPGVNFQPAIEEHPLVDKGKKKKKDKKEKRERTSLMRPAQHQGDSMELEESGHGTEQQSFHLGKTNYGALGHGQAYDHFV